jgi:cytochrome d ubiquinol oxidase subunit II
VLAGGASIVLLVVRRYGIARITSSVAVATILIGWALGQYPYLLLPYLTIEEAARGEATLVAMTVVLILGSLLLAPALVFMFVLFSRPESAPGRTDRPSGHGELRDVGGSVTAR